MGELSIFSYSCGHAVKSYDDEDEKTRYKKCPECKNGDLEGVSKIIPPIV